MPSSGRRERSGIKLFRTRSRADLLEGIPTGPPPIDLGEGFLLFQWHNSRMNSLPKSIDDTLALLARGDYVAERSLATAVFLALKMKRPLFLEGEAGVGKTEIAKVTAVTLSAA